MPDPPPAPTDLPRAQHVPRLPGPDLVPPGLAADHVHGPAGVGGARADAFMPRTKPGGDQAGLGPARSAGTTSPAPRRPRTSCARSSTTCATPRASASSARRCPKGILLHGPPGHRQDAARKAVAHESGATLLLAVGGLVRRDVRRRWAPPGSARLFKVARKHAPAIIFIDELDAVGGHRGDGRSAASGTRRSTSCWSRWTASRLASDVVVIAASNLLEKLDPALLRPGRFDRQIFVSPPDVHRPRADPPRPLAQQADRRRRRPRSCSRARPRA